MDVYYNIQQTAQTTIYKIVNVVSGYKILLMDAETIKILSLFQTKSKLQENDVLLFLNIELERGNDNFPYVTAIIFIIPTVNTIKALKKELLAPKYGLYYIYFNGNINDTDLKGVAKCDKYRKIQCVKEVYLNYYPLLPNLFCVNAHKLNMFSEQLLFVLKSLNCNPLVRYYNGSTDGKIIAESVQKEITITRRTDTILLILDRSIDMLTPLITPWVYHAMIHEYLHINNGTTKLSTNEEISFLPDHDDFFQKNMNTNWGKLALNIKNMLITMQNSSDSTKIKTIEDIQLAMIKLPETLHTKDILSKHMKIYSDIIKIIKSRSMYRVGAIEQELAISSSSNETIYNKLVELLDDKMICDYDKVRLVMIYGLKYANVDTLLTKINDEHHKLLIKSVLKYKLQSTTNNKWYSTVLTFMDNIASIDNNTPIYTQYKPFVSNILTDINSGKLSLDIFPYVNPSYVLEKPKKIIVFFLGGITCMETALTDTFKNVLFGSDCIHNTKSFIETL